MLISETFFFVFFAKKIFFFTIFFSTSFFQFFSPFFSIFFKDWKKMKRKYFFSKKIFFSKYFCSKKYFFQKKYFFREAFKKNPVKFGNCSQIAGDPPTLAYLGILNCYFFYWLFGLNIPWNGFWELIFSLAKVVWHLEKFYCLPYIQ